MTVYLRCSECHIASPSGADAIEAENTAKLCGWNTKDIAKATCTTCVAKTQQCPFHGIGEYIEDFGVESQCRLPIHHEGKCQL